MKSGFELSVTDTSGGCRVTASVGGEKNRLAGGNRCMETPVLANRPYVSPSGKSAKRTQAALFFKSIYCIYF